MSNLKGKFKVSRIMYPKNVNTVERGEWGVILCTLEETLEGEFKKNKYGSYKLTGILPAIDLFDDITYTVTATELIDPQYGVSYPIVYSFTDYEIETKEGKEIFLKSFLTDHQIKNLYKELDDPFEVIESGNIDLLSTVKGFGEKTSLKVVERFIGNKDYGKILVELPDVNLSPSLLSKLIDKYKNPDTIVEVIKENPYVLASEIDGIGWKKADAVAMGMGYPENGAYRVSSFINFFLTERANSGFSWVTPNDLQENLLEAIPTLDNSAFGEAMHYLHDSGRIVWDKEKTFIALRYFFELEKKISEELLRLMGGEKVTVSDEEKLKVLDAIEQEQGWEFTSEQRRAVDLAINHNVCVVTGLGGTGKSTSVDATLKVLSDFTSAQTALSGKASSRLQEITGEESFTIHRLLGYNPSSGFTINEDNKLNYQIIILDETSMVGGEIFYSLIKSIETGSKLILLGDEGQLESIGSLNIFKDVLDSNIVPTISLMEIHRQAKKSAIIMDSVKIRHNEKIIEKGWCGQEIRGELRDVKLDFYDDKLFTSLRVMENYKELFGIYKTSKDITVVVPTKFNGDASAFDMNRDIQEFVNPPSAEKSEVQNFSYEKGDKKYFTMREGDRILVKKNNYKTQTPIFNGYLGTVVDITTKSMMVDFDIVGMVEVPKKLWSTILLGYAITGHSMQGSENKAIIVGMDYSGYMTLSREWVYTALTRAKEYCCICAETSAFSYALATSRVKHKQTFLKGFLNGETYE